MIKLREEYPVEEIGEKQLHAVQEDNRIMTGLKNLVAAWDFDKFDIEDLAEICWRSGFQYASDRFFHLASEEEQTKLHEQGGLPNPKALVQIPKEAVYINRNVLLELLKEENCPECPAMFEEGWFKGRKALKQKIREKIEAL